jgi:hypothetical protein
MRRVAFGPNDTWVVFEDDGDDIDWSLGLPTKLWNVLNGRYCNSGQHNSGVKVLAFTEDDYFVQFQNGAYKSLGDNDMYESLDDATSDGCTIEFFSFGDNGSYVFGGGGQVFWRNVPSRMNQLIRTRNQSNIDWAAIGDDGAWFLLYSDGCCYWDGFSDNLDETAEGDRGIANLFLSPFNENYYVNFYDSNCEWVGPNSLSNSINKDKKLNPTYIYYSNNSISDTFSCGRSIYEVRDGLESGDIDYDDIPMIRVVNVDGAWYGLDNRRLWVFSQAGTPEIPVSVVDASWGLMNRLSGFDGRSVRIRG